MSLSNPLKALKPQPEVVPEKVLHEVIPLKTEPEWLYDKTPETVPEKQPPGKAEVKEKTPEKLLVPETKVEEIPKQVVPEKVPEKVPVSEKPPPEKKPLKVPRKVKEERAPEKKPPAEQVKPEKVSKKQAEMFSVDERIPITVPEKTPEKVPEAKPEPEVEEPLPEGTTEADLNSFFSLSLDACHVSATIQL